LSSSARQKPGISVRPAAWAALVEFQEVLERQRPHGDGLNQPVGLDRFGQLGEVGVVKVFARVAGRGNDLAHWQHGHGNRVSG